MRWGFFCGVILAVILIFCVEWPKLKHKPKKDKISFVTLLLIACCLSMLDLPHTPGPTRALEFIYRPFKGLVEFSS